MIESLCPVPVFHIASHCDNRTSRMNLKKLILNMIRSKKEKEQLRRSGHLNFCASLYHVGF